jgi:hypothetical protein
MIDNSRRACRMWIGHLLRLALGFLPCAAQTAGAETSPSKPIISAPVAPRTVESGPAKPRPTGPVVTVPEGEPLPQAAPPKRAPVADPSIQLKLQPSK